MTLKKKLIFLLIFTSFNIWAQTPADWINPFIGTSNKGNTHPGATVPWGLASVSPHTLNTPKGGHNYEFGAPFIYGFGHVQLSGVGCGDAGNIVFMPVSGSKDLFNAESRKSSYRNEKATAGFYSCILDKPGAKIQSTATQRTGKSLIHFQNKKGGVVFDMMMNKSTEKGGFLKKVDDTEIEGWQMGGKFCGMPLTRKVYFVAKVRANQCKLRLFKDSTFIEQDQIEGLSVGCYFYSDSLNDAGLEVSVGISFVSVKNARLNLETEQGRYSFNEIRQSAVEKWNKEICIVKIEGGTPDELTNFYTAYYHALLSPVVFSDVNGEYLSMQTDSAKSREIYKTEDTQYTFYSLWDTYRTVHPFLTLLHPNKQEDMIKSMLNMYEQGGWLPKWELYGQESWVMVGDPAAIVIGDSYLKGIRNFDKELAWKALQKGALQFHPQNYVRPGNENYWKYGYIPIDKRGGTDSTKFNWTTGYVWGTVSSSLEYQLADYNIGIFANAIGKNKEAIKFFKQSQKIHLLFDPQTKTFRPKYHTGRWKEPYNTKDRNFDIRWQASGGHGFVEGDAWNYRFFSPHNMPLLITLYGGEKPFVDTLQKLFDDGHFDMSNEPDITYPYLFNYVKGEEWRTQKTVTACIKKYFSTSPGGLPGNDDAGTISAWLAFSMLGIFPDCPGKADYQITNPVFDKVTIMLNRNGAFSKDLVIKKSGKGNTIREILWNGKAINKFQISHQSLINGGTLEVINE